MKRGQEDWMMNWIPGVRLVHLLVCQPMIVITRHLTTPQTLVQVGFTNFQLESHGINFVHYADKEDDRDEEGHGHKRKRKQSSAPVDNSGRFLLNSSSLTCSVSKENI